MIHREDADGIVVLRLEHGTANAIDLELFEALEERLGSLAADPGVRALVLTGTGGIFSAGVDLFRVLAGGRDYLVAFLPVLSRALGALFTVPLPVVCAVNGHAIAGGCILAMAGDHVVMAAGRATIGISELLVGVPFPVTAFEVLRHRLGNRAAEALAYDGRPLDAAGALAGGLVDETVAAEALMPHALAVAGRLASIPRAAFALTKRQTRAPALARIAVTAGTDDEVLARWAAPATQDAIRAFMDRTVGAKKG